MAYLFPGLLLVLLASSSLLPRPAVAQSTQQVTAQVRSARLAQNAALAARLIDSAATFWTADVIIVTSRGQALRGKEAYRLAFVGDSVMTYVRTPLRIEAASAWPLAWEEGVWSGHMGTGGAAVIGGRYAAQWHKIDGRWLIRSEVFVALTCSGEPCSWPVVTP